MKVKVGTTNFLNSTFCPRSDGQMVSVSKNKQVPPRRSGKSFFFLAITAFVVRTKRAVTIEKQKGK